MMLAFDQVDTSTVADPSTVSFAIGEVLIATLIGLAISILGAILILLAIYTTDYRAPWLLTALFVIGLLLTLAFPIGTLFGIALLVTAAVKRHEFLNTKQQPPP